MRPSAAVAATMASFYAMCRLHLSVRGGPVKYLQKVDHFLFRNAGTSVAQREVLRKDEADEKGGKKSFYAIQAVRQEEAERSVLISCASVNEKKFLKYLSSHGNIKNYFFYERNGMHAVVEYADREGVASLLEETVISGFNHECLVPFKSRLLRLKNQSLAQPPKQNSGPRCLTQQTTIHIKNLIQSLSKETSIDQQVISLKEAYQLTEENIRLRFLVCSLLKDIAASYFPECTIKPFGSSVNGFGKLDCDLDMILDLDGISGRNPKMRTQIQIPADMYERAAEFLPPLSDLSLEYQLKRTGSARAVTQSVLSVIGDCVNQIGPGYVGMQKILNARCPLIRFAHQPSGFQCDLTASNRVAMKSTELLYLYGELDPRVRCLVFTVRCWARAHGITSGIPGAWITNFSLTVMVLFFLQTRSQPIIPTLDHLKELAGPADKCEFDGNDCTFVSDFSKIQLQHNTETLEQLLTEFFEFYATFAFDKMSVNIRKSGAQMKPVVDPLHIQNPFEASHNVSKNVNITQLNRFVASCQESSWLLQQSNTNTPGGGHGDNTAKPWGLASLLMPSQVAGQGQKKKRPPSHRLKSLLESLRNNDQKIQKS